MAGTEAAALLHLEAALEELPEQVIIHVGLLMLPGSAEGQAMDQHWAMERGEVVMLVMNTTGMNPDHIMLSREDSHKGHTAYDSDYTRCPESADAHREWTQWLPRVGAGREGRAMANGHRVPFGGDENALKETVVMVTYAEYLLKSTELQILKQ